ncbi:MAG: coproporphyrinogen III oxidase, partial [Betaproteobacteria bacterium]|nr:coproporphyrinogen III oxidase [Betaproteobacteria bacterium]
MTGILHQAKQYFLGLQSSIIEHLEGLDGRSFAIDQWD